MLLSGFDWNRTTPLISIRNYEMNLLLQLVFIHNELYKSELDEKLVQWVLSTLLENIYQTYIDCISLIENFSDHGKLQAGEEIEFISSILSKYKTEISEKLYHALDQTLGYSHQKKTNQVAYKHATTILKETLNSTGLLFECFTKNHVL